MPRILELCGVRPAAEAAAAAGDVGESGSGGEQQEEVRHQARRQPRPVYVVCRRGNHSQLAVQELRAAGLLEAYDLIGGMEAWAEEVDPSMPVL